MSKASLKQLSYNRIQLVLELPTLGEADVAVLANSVNCLDIFFFKKSSVFRRIRTEYRISTIQ